MAAVTIDKDIRVRLSSDLKSRLGYECDEVKVSDLRRICGEIRGEMEPFHRLISKCKVILPEPKYPPRCPEFEARLEKLRKLHEKREYERMVNNVDATRKTLAIDEPIGKQLEELNRYLLLMFQFILSAASAFLFGYMGPYYFYGTTATGPRLLYGVVGAFVVGVADLYFILKHLLETEGVMGHNCVDK